MINTIDKVALYPFSPLKLLHETRKMTAAQAKFFVALMCLYFEKYGALDWYGVEGAEEKHAASYAPYCGVTKKTFIKMIDALQTAGVVYINDCGQITPIIAQEIREAVKQGTHQILECNESDAGVKVEATPVVAANREAKEVTALEAARRFQDGNMGGGDREENVTANDALDNDALDDEQTRLFLEGVNEMIAQKRREAANKAIHDSLKFKNFIQVKEQLSSEDYKIYVDAHNALIRTYPWRELDDEGKAEARLLSMRQAENVLEDIEWKKIPLSQRRSEISGKIELVKKLAVEKFNIEIEDEEYRPVAITKRILFEARQFVKEEPDLIDLLEPLIKARDIECKKYFGDDWEDDWVSPKVWEKLPSLLDEANTGVI